MPRPTKILTATLFCNMGTSGKRKYFGKVYFKKSYKGQSQFFHQIQRRALSALMPVKRLALQVELSNTGIKVPGTNSIRIRNKGILNSVVNLP